MRPRLKLDVNNYNSLLSAIGTQDTVTLKVKANTLKLDDAIAKNSLSRKDLRTNSVNFTEDDSFYRGLRSYEKPKLGWSCELEIIKLDAHHPDNEDGLDDVFTYNIYLPVAQTECKSKDVNFTINKRTVKVIVEETEIFWILEVNKIY
jgi:hypothetical protein